MILLMELYHVKYKILETPKGRNDSTMSMICKFLILTYIDLIPNKIQLEMHRTCSCTFYFLL